MESEKDTHWEPKVTGDRRKLEKWFELPEILGFGLKECQSLKMIDIISALQRGYSLETSFRKDRK